MSDRPRYYGRDLAPMTLLEWAAKMEDAEYKRVLLTKVVSRNVDVSTVWLGLDHAFGGPTPLIFETLVFGGPLDGDGERYATEEDARLGHERWVERVLREPADAGGGDQR